MFDTNVTEQLNSYLNHVLRSIVDNAPISRDFNMPSELIYLMLKDIIRKEMDEILYEIVF